MKHVRFKLFSSGRLRLLVAAFAALSLVFSVALVGAYMNHSLEVANQLAVQRTVSLAEALQAKLKALFLSASMLYQDQGVFNWINAASITSELDIAMVQSTGSFMQSNLDAEGVILYNQSEGKIYELSRSRRQLYRDESLLEEADVLRMLREPEAQHLRYQVITYQGKEALAFLLPHAVRRTAGSALVLVMNPDAIANDVSNVLVSDPLDGSTTFVMTDEGRLVMGSAPQQLLDTVSLLGEDVSSASPWSSFLRTGYLAHSQRLSLQEWTVCSVLYVDSFLTSHMPFVKVMLAMLLALAAMLVIFFLAYAYLMHQPYSRLAMELTDRLPGTARDEAVPAGARRDVPAELRSAINCLLSQVTAVEVNAQHQLRNSRFNAWVNTLGSERQMDVDQAEFFPHAQLQMGVARIMGYNPRQPDYFRQRSLRQEVGSVLRGEMARRWPQAYCVDMGDGAFVLFINAPALEEGSLAQCLHPAIRQLEDTLRVMVCCAVSEVLAPGDRGLPEVCRELHRASFWGLVSGGSTVCTLREYQACCAEYAAEDDQQAIARVTEAVRSGDAEAMDSAVARYGRMLSGWPAEKRQGSVWAMHMALFYNFGKYLTAADYERCQRLLAEDRSLPEITDNLRALCQGIRQRSAPSGEAAAQWHSIILDISEYIQNNIADPQLSVDMIAQREGYSANYVRAMFKTYVGVSISDYIRDKRIEMACRLLSTSSVPVARVMACSGFVNKSSFFTQFRNKTGLTPNEYRLQHGRPAGDSPEEA